MEPMTGRADQRLTLPEISDLVVTCLVEVVAERDGEEVTAGPTTRLVGPRSVLDSLGLVTLIVEVEDRLRTAHGISVALANDQAMSQARSPFLTVQTLSEYIGSILNDGG